MTKAGIWFGVDYYPEQWPKSRWKTDVELFGEAGFNVVRLAEFAWCRIEPSPGRFDFSWLDEIIGELAEKGIKVVLGTPTAAPPPWLVKLHPDILPVSYRGYRMPPVARRHYCPNNPNYIRATERVVKALAEHYKDDPNVVGYQIDNELSLDDEYCYCEHCVRLFREWLERKYGDVEELNRAYGTVFWSHEYRDWAEIHPPTPPFDMCNRGLALDWLRFRSESFIKYLELQAGVIRSVSPGKKITTNLMGLFPGIDYYELSRRLDFPSWDCYPKFSSADYDPAWVAMLHDATRCMGRDRSYWVMELQAGPTDGYFGHRIGATPEPGELRKWAYQAVAHGAEGVVYFRWRTACFGKEQFWHGILNHDGEVNRRYLEVKRLGEELGKVKELVAGTKYPSRVGLVFSYEALWSTLIEKGYYATGYHDQVLSIYKGFWLRGINVDVIPPGEDFTRYSVLLTPFLYLTGKSLIARLKEFVYNGGILVATARTSVKDEYNRVYSDGLPGGLTDLFGARVTDYTSLPDGRKASILMEGGAVEAAGWLEELTPTTAQVLGVHDYGWLKGKAAVTVNRYGRGCAVYVGSFPSPSIADRVANALIERGVIEPLVRVEGDRLELTVREGSHYRLVFLINHEGRDKTAKLHFAEAFRVKELLKGGSSQGETQEYELKLGPHDVEILYLE